jgi:hypothetical protein
MVGLNTISYLFKRAKVVLTGIGCTGDGDLEPNPEVNDVKRWFNLPFNFPRLLVF